MVDEWDSPEGFARREAEQRATAERERKAMCELLRHRGYEAAALVVAASTMTSDCVDNWDGGQYEVTLGVPAPLYDGARSEEIFAHLSEAAEAIVTAKHYRGLEITLRRSDAPDGWDAAVIADILARERATPTVHPVIPHGQMPA